jgi:glycine cleavage system H protein
VKSQSQYIMSKKYSTEHVWIELEADSTDAPLSAHIGITEHAQEALGDIVFAELPTLEQEFKAGQALAVIESVKAAADVLAPASVRINQINTALKDDPSLLNTDPLGKGWLVRAQVTQSHELSALMDEAAYAQFCSSQ